MEPADFYTGLVAELYGPLKGHSQAAPPYAEFIGLHGQPALELGCGDGEPLLDLRRLGLDVEGLDSSADMLDRCQRMAKNKGRAVVLHHQKMEDFDLGRTYRSIFLAGPTFTLLPDDDVALRALRRIRAHLDEDGMALVPLFIPEPMPAEDLGSAREKTADDGGTLRLTYLSQDRDEELRLQRTRLRYERIGGAGDAVAEREWTIHWHTRAGFASLAARAGLSVAEVRDGDDPATEFSFYLRP